MKTELIFRVLKLSKQKAFKLNNNRFVGIFWNTLIMIEIWNLKSKSLIKIFT